MVEKFFIDLLGIYLAGLLFILLTVVLIGLLMLAFWKFLKKEMV